jgi:hypothetical protein|tara:strand:+ start:3423 stop:3653 length:231 start_codon:yes stop_codon:yes gene_type:complete
MIKVSDKKLTPNQFAKLVVVQWGTEGAEYWEERTSCDYFAELITEREKQQINEALVKQTRRIEDFFGLEKLPLWIL